MRRVCREAESDDILLLAVRLEGDRDVTLVAIQDKHSPDPLPPPLRILVEVLNPLHTSGIICPAACRSPNRLVAWEAAISVPRRKVVFALNYQH